MEYVFVKTKIKNMVSLIKTAMKSLNLTFKKLTRFLKIWRVSK